MADRGNVQRRGSITNLVGRAGQTTTGLPGNSSENYFYTILESLGRGDLSENRYIPISYTVNGTPDDKTSLETFQLNKIIGYIDLKTPQPFNLEAGGGGGAINYYKMRGYYTLGSVYEYWVSSESPSLTPPSGHSLIDIVIASTWQV